MSPTERDDTRRWIWLAGAVGTAAGLAALAYSRREPSRWEQARRTVVRAAETAREEAKPWMGAVAAGVLAGSGALAYRLSRKETTWDQTRQRASRMAARTGDQLRPWLSIAASTALSLATAAYNRKEWARANRTVSETAGAAADKIAGTGLSLFNRVQRISGETRKLYPRVRKLIA